MVRWRGKGAVRMCRLCMEGGSFGGRRFTSVCCTSSVQDLVLRGGRGVVHYCVCRFCLVLAKSISGFVLGGGESLFSVVLEWGWGV